jgi:hypothetical protein
MVDEGTDISEFEPFPLKKLQRKRPLSRRNPRTVAQGPPRLPRKRKSLHQSRKSQTQKEEGWKQALTESPMRAHLQRL